MVEVENFRARIQTLMDVSLELTVDDPEKPVIPGKRAILKLKPPKV